MEVYKQRMGRYVCAELHVMEDSALTEEDEFFV